MKTSISPKTFLLCIPLFLIGCATAPSTVVQTVEVPVPVKCMITVPEKPSVPFTDLNWETLTPEVKKDLHYWIKLLLAEIEFRKGYEKKIEVAIETCNK